MLFAILATIAAAIGFFFASLAVGTAWLNRVIEKDRIAAQAAVVLPAAPEEINLWY